VTTQLRLVEPPEPRPRASRAKGPARAGSRTRTTRARTGRRSASWGDWRLDAGTRRIGRAGVAAARQALQAAVETDLDHGLRAS
jgi:hypothetical protein